MLGSNQAMRDAWLVTGECTLETRGRPNLHIHLIYAVFLDPVPRHVLSEELGWLGMLHSLV